MWHFSRRIHFLTGCAEFYVTWKVYLNFISLLWKYDSFKVLAQPKAWVPMKHRERHGNTPYYNKKRESKGEAKWQEERKLSTSWNYKILDDVATSQWQFNLQLKSCFATPQFTDPILFAICKFVICYFLFVRLTNNIIFKSFSVFVLFLRI